MKASFTIDMDAVPHRSPPHSRVEKAEGAAARWPRLYAVMVTAWLFDFRSEGEGQGLAIQTIFLAVYLFAFTLFLIAEASSQLRIRWLPSLMTAGGLYLTVGIASGLLYGQDIYPILRNSVSVFVYLSATYATATTVAKTDPTRLRQVLAVLCMGYAISTFLIFNATSGGIDVDKVRYQIIGASNMAALGYVVLLVMFRLSYLQLATLLINLAILLLSVTRTFLLSFIAQAMVVALEFRRLFTLRMIMLGALALCVVAGALSLGSGQVLRWEDRLGEETGAGTMRDETLNTRLSEWEFMSREWTASPGNFMFGSGFAAKTTYFYSREVGGYSESMVGFGHNQHLSMLFNGGFLGGFPLLALMWFNGLMAFRFLRQTARRPDMRSDLVFLGAWGATMILGFLVADILSSTFGTRGPALWYGVGTGLLLGAQACFDPENGRRRTTRRVAPTPRRRGA